MGNSSSAVKFSEDQIPSLTGKIAIVTGGNIGIGFAISKALAVKGATVYIASRNADKVNQAVQEIKTLSGNDHIYGEVVDLASLASIDAFVTSLSSKINHIDVLVDNAALFIPPFGKTAEGFELTLGVNSVGNVYLTDQLLPLLLKSSAARIVMLSSLAINQASNKLFADILNNDIGGEKLVAEDVTLELYGLSKLFQTMYATDLQRRLDAKGIKNVFVASVHPGGVRTDGINKANQDLLLVRVFAVLIPFIAVSPEVGALSPLFLATAPLSEIEKYKGGVLNEGPNIKPLPISTKDFTPENCVKVYDALRALIERKGHHWIEV